MSPVLSALKKRAAALAAILLVVLAYGIARAPSASLSEKRALAARFHFDRYGLPRLAGVSDAAYDRKLRTVHQDLAGISSWISSVGAAVSLADIEGDGLPQDIVLVDPRIDKVIVQPVPGTESSPTRKRGSYQPFALDSSLVDTKTCAPMGSVCGDFNENGLTDILVYYWGRSPIIFVQKPGIKGPLRRECFQEMELVPGHPRWFSNAATSCDLDGDGHLDLVVANYFADSSAILDSNDTSPQYMQESMSRGFNGGFKHFFLGNGRADGFREVEPLDENGKPYPKRWNSDHNAWWPPAAFSGWTLAVGACDLNGDSLPELYFANDFGPDRLFENFSVPGSLRLELVTGRKTLFSANSRVLGNDSFKGMGVDFWDLNGDGVPDIFVSNIADSYALEESHFAFMSQPGKPIFEGNQTNYVDEGEALNLARDGWGWDVKLGDFDDSGTPQVLRAVNFVSGWKNAWPELHEKAMGNDFLLKYPRQWPKFTPGIEISGHHSMPFYVMGSGGSFVDVSKDVGIGDVGVSRGVATGDVEGNGKLDFIVANQWGPSYYFRNESRTTNKYLELNVEFRLKSDPDQRCELVPGDSEAVGRCRPAIGAEVDVTTPDGRTQDEQVDGGNGHSGKRAPELLFGLGNLHSGNVSISAFWRADGERHSIGPMRCAPGRYTLLLPAPKDHPSTS